MPQLFYCYNSDFLKLKILLGSEMAAQLICPDLQVRKTAHCRIQTFLKAYFKFNLIPVYKFAIIPSFLSKSVLEKSVLFLSGKRRIL